MATQQERSRRIEEKVALGNRIMFHQGLADYHGHVSARIPGTRQFFIKPVLAPLGEVAPKTYHRSSTSTNTWKFASRTTHKAGSKRDGDQN